MQTRHYVEKTGYWIYDSVDKKVRHSDMYPYHNIHQWVYVGSPGHIIIQDDKILDFIPINDTDSYDLNKPFCYHIPKEYIGFTDKFMYCAKCGIKL